MLRYIVKRVLMLIPVLFCVAFLIFTMMYFSRGDPATMILGDQATPEQLTEWRVEHGLDKPFWEQFVNYIWGIVSRGDFGTSYHSGLSVTESIMERFPTTFVLAVATCSIAIICGCCWESLRQIIRAHGLTTYCGSSVWRAFQCPFSGWGC